MIVRILPAAEAELEAIGDYIARDNPRRALSFVRELHDKCMSLADMPLAYPLVPRYEDRPGGRSNSPMYGHLKIPQVTIAG
ncbi:plasmid stabilization system protein [Caballeronia arationis]|uniref:type II toxin-antitoxin system RelE/ParE family toxin n=1 Tax=Caballeronia arationis TaxID=1777142 RepID=UPI00074BC669|nr:type II toxin-antitoxin system RelE/ParE family toxin [Caballeronia arationis]SAL07921.1 plasmid stabilization system protein [Caballeronia arationis]